jgi:DNA end-binding protein Ku
MRRSLRPPSIIALAETRGSGLKNLITTFEAIREEGMDDIPNEKIPKDMLELASHIVKSKAGHFHPEKFEDRYEDALKELLRKKQAGEKIEAPKERAPAKIVSLMDALRRSVDAERGGGERCRGERHATARHRAPKKAARSSARKKAG